MLPCLMEEVLRQLQLLPQQLGSATLLLLLLFTISLLLSYWKSTHLTRQRQNELPSPAKLPIIGNLHQLGLHPHCSLRDLSIKHGPLMLLHLGRVPTIVASTANMAREIMKTHDVGFSGRPSTIFAKRLLYNCNDVAFAPYSDYWRQIRKICVVHLLSARQVLSARSVREEEVAGMINKIASSTSTPIDLSKMFIELTNDITFRIALGKKYTDEVNTGGLGETLDELVALLGAFNVAEFIPCLSWLNKINGLNARVAKCSTDLDKLLEKVVEDHQQQMRQQQQNLFENTSTDRHHQDDRSFLDILLRLGESNTTGDQFSIGRTTMKAIILDVFAAGIHTTFTVIDWAMTEMIRNPIVMRKAQEEVRRKVGKEKGMVGESDVQHMDYLKMVIKEVLRAHPPVPLLIPRESTQEVVLQGYRIPKGTRVLVNAWAISMDPEVWERPEDFWPERFLGFPEVDYKGADFQLIPFGAGRRSCPGIGFSVQIVELALANLLNRFEWDLPEGVKVEDMDMTEATGLTGSRKASLVLVARSSFDDPASMVSSN